MKRSLAPLLTLVALAAITVPFAGCPKKKPATPAQDVSTQTTTVQPTAPAPTQEVEPSVATPTEDRTEDLLLSEDLQIVNAELARRGFAADVYFNYDEATLSDETRDRLNRNAELLRGAPQLQLLIEGHADERGTNEYNLALGERRANAAKSYLATLGIGDARLRTLSYGEERPVCTETDESCWAQNRRAHMVVTGRTQG
jgi:peptidoglycan-associated lipoprotein